MEIIARAQRSAKEFRLAAESRQITRWEIHECSMCGYPCAYEFEDGFVAYDAGCYCTSRRRYEARTLEDVAFHYNLQSHPETIERYNVFWGFDVDGGQDKPSGTAEPGTPA